jgi:hypothetical protein
MTALITARPDPNRSSAIASPHHHHHRRVQLRVPSFHHHPIHNYSHLPVVVAKCPLPARRLSSRDTTVVRPLQPARGRSLLNLRLSRSLNFLPRTRHPLPLQQPPRERSIPPSPKRESKGAKFLAFRSPSLKNLPQGCNLSSTLGLSRHTLTPAEPQHRIIPSPHSIYRPDRRGPEETESLALPEPQR